RESLDAIEVGIIPRGGTNLGAAMDAGLEAFEGRQGNHEALVLITDGESHEGDVKEATKRAQERGVKIYTVGIGTAEGELVPADAGGYVKDRKGQVVKSRLDEDTLKQIATDTGGVYLHAEGASFGLAAVSVAWLDPHATAREASRLYASGKFDDAAGKYNEALVDRPDSPLLHFNLGDALYRQGKFTDAVNALQQVPGTDADSTRTARVAYNIGNAKCRLAQAAEASDPKSALGLYAEALAAYRRTMGAAPDDVDAKFNHECV